MIIIVNVLVIEDDAVAKELIAVQLQAVDFFPVFAADGYSGLQLLDEHSFSLVISDYELPDINGVSLLRMIKEKQPRLPIVILSAHAEEVVRDVVLNNGADLYVTKPFNVFQIKETLSTLLGESVSIGSSSLEDSRETSKLFLELMPGYFETLKNAAIKEDLDTVGSVIHKMKGAFSVCKDVSLVSLLQKLGEVQDCTESLLPLIEVFGKKLKDYYSILQDEINRG